MSPTLLKKVSGFQRKLYLLTVQLNQLLMRMIKSRLATGSNIVLNQIKEMIITKRKTTLASVKTIQF